MIYHQDHTILWPLLHRMNQEETSNKTTPNASTTHMLEQIKLLQDEKNKLESELKSREEMMNNLIYYIRNSSV